MTLVGQNVEECPHKIETFASDIGDLKDRTYSLADELRSRLYRLFTVLDEDGDLPCSLRLENAAQLGDRLLKNLWRANIDFSDDNHDRHIER